MSTLWGRPTKVGRAFQCNLEPIAMRAMYLRSIMKSHTNMFEDDVFFFQAQFESCLSMCQRRQNQLYSNLHEVRLTVFPTFQHNHSFPLTLLYHTRGDFRRCCPGTTILMYTIVLEQFRPHNVRVRFGSLVVFSKAGFVFPH